MAKGLTSGKRNGSTTDNEVGGESGILNGNSTEIRDSETGGESAGDGYGESSAGIFTEPGNLKGGYTESAGDGEAPKKRRGRPPGSGKSAGVKTSSAKPKAVPTSLDGIEKILLSLHMMGASMLNVPELMLSEKEASDLSEAIARVAALYDFGASEKTLAWTNLAVCMGGMYGTRFFAFNLRMKAEAEAKKAKVQPISGPFNMAQNATP
jgi:hypothetical protein